MDNTNLIQQIINHHTKVLADRIIADSFIDIESLSIIIKMHFKQAMMEILMQQIPLTEKKLNSLKLKAVETSNNKDIVQQIIPLKAKLKKENELFANLKTNNKNKQMALWMKKYHPQSLLDFYQFLNTQFQIHNL